MNHPEAELSFFDSTDLGLEELKQINEILRAKKRGQVKFPWDTFSTNGKKRDENGNNIAQPSFCETGPDQHEAVSVSESVNASVVIQPSLIPVGSDCMSIHSAALPPHVYPPPHFVRYTPVNHEMMLTSHPPIPLGHPTQGLQSGSHGAPSVEVGQIDNLHTLEDQIDVTAQPVHHLPYSTLPQPYQSVPPPLFYSPSGPAPPPRGQPFFYFPLPYQAPSYPMHQNVPVTMATNACVIDETVAAVEPVSGVVYCDNQNLYSEEQHINNNEIGHQNNEFFEEPAANSEQVLENNCVENSEYSNSVNTAANDSIKSDLGYSETIDTEVSPQSSDTEVDSLKASSLDTECDQNNSLSAPENEVSPERAESSVVPVNSSVKPRSWASLFSKNTLNSVDQDGKLTNGNSHESNQIKTDFINRKSLSKDNSRHSTARDVLSRFEVRHRSVHLLPCGLVNRSNWCYINAVLQAVLVCPPFYNLMREMPIVPDDKNGSSTPILDSLVEFVHSFGSLHLNNFKNRRKDELSVGKPFEPTNIYRMLSRLRSSCVKGRQEDAEEFLSCILDGIHEEMLALMKRNTTERVGSLGSGIGNGTNEDVSQMNGCAAEDEWLVIGGKNKGVVTRTANYVKSPISEIFGGQLRSLLKRSGSGPTANLEPFFTLQLDVQSDEVNSIKDALHGLVSKEAVEGFVCAKTGNEVEASRRLTLEELPPVLILHIKRFVYNKDGGCQKILKQVEYNSDLELSADLLSPEVRSKYKKMRSYKLFAVVYHNGKEAVKGHYITDAYHSGSNGWLRFDDSSVHSISENQVVKHCPPRVPYLLFYKRQKTM